MGEFPNRQKLVVLSRHLVEKLLLFQSLSHYRSRMGLIPPIEVYSGVWPRLRPRRVDGTPAVLPQPFQFIEQVGEVIDRRHRERLVGPLHQAEAPVESRSRVGIRDSLIVFFQCLPHRRKCVGGGLFIGHGLSHLVAALPAKPIVATVGHHVSAHVAIRVFRLFTHRAPPAGGWRGRRRG